MHNSQEIWYDGIGNPLRYRGYYFDVETGLYYLNARYYDPQTSRFLNADDNLAGELNLYEYCYSNPVNYFDEDGQAPKKVVTVEKKSSGTTVVTTTTVDAPGNDDPAPKEKSNSSDVFWPSDKKFKVTTSPFGKRDGVMHKGIDIGWADGKNVYAATEGTVTSVHDSNTGAGGRYIIITNDKIVTKYMHLKKDSLLVKKGAKVSAKQQIATMGGSASKSESGVDVHLHFELWIDGTAVDPIKYVKER